MKPIDRLSLGWRTDLIFARFDGEVVERPECLVVRAAHNPTYYWGNFLLFDHPPQAGDAARWLAIFDAEIAGRQPASRHLAFGVDSAEPFELPADFVALGISMYPWTVLAMRRGQLRPLRRTLPPSDFSIRALRLPEEAAQAVEHQVASDAGGYEPEGYRVFRQRQMARYGRMEAAGLGHWFGVFAATPSGERLVADCGLFRDGAGPGSLGRFQLVATHPAWRRRGLCSALVHAVCRHGFEAMAIERLVIVADPDDVAIGLYESLGFERQHGAWCLERRAASDSAA